MTQQSLYSLLNADTKAWWYHKKLRDQGNHTEARSRERQSILSSVETVRNAYFFSVGPYGHSIYSRTMRKYGGTCSSTLQGYGGVKDATIQACIRMGVPGVDITRLQDKHGYVRDVLGCPIVSDTKDEPREDGTYGSCSYAPREAIIEYWRSRGADIYNG